MDKLKKQKQNHLVICGTVNLSVCEMKPASKCIPQDLYLKGPDQVHKAVFEE